MIGACFQIQLHRVVQMKDEDDPCKGLQKSSAGDLLRFISQLL